LARGFTLIEVMITVAVIGILTAVALPIYSEYVMRGRLVDAINALSGLRARMEQHFTDNRTYATSGAITSPCASSFAAGAFTISCSNLTATTYTATATGSGTVASFTFTINQDGTMATTSLPTAWGSATSGCWITRKGGSC
jgi:type IV pilus assembly protein PilE